MDWKTHFLPRGISAELIGEMQHDDLAMKRIEDGEHQLVLMTSENLFQILFAVPLTKVGELTLQALSSPGFSSRSSETVVGTVCKPRYFPRTPLAGPPLQQRSPYYSRQLYGKETC